MLLILQSKVNSIANATYDFTDFCAVFTLKTWRYSYYKQKKCFNVPKCQESVSNKNRKSNVLSN